MTGWLRFDDLTPERPSVVALSDREFRLWFNAVCYCHRNKTDGLVPVALAPSLSRTATKGTVAALVAVGKFEKRSDDHYYVHDYLDHNPSKERLAELREAGKRRSEAWRATRQKQNGDALQTHLPHARARRRPQKSVSVRGVDVDVDVSDNGTVVAREPSRTVDQAALPADLPPELHETAEKALAVLAGVHEMRGGNTPTLRGVGLAVRRFPDRDHLGVVRKLEHWALAGSGQRKVVRDWARTFATFLEGEPTAKPTSTLAPANSHANGSGRQTASDMLRAIRDRQAVAS